MDPTAAPTELQLNGTTYTAYPFRDIDHETMNKWVRRAYIERVRDFIDADPELQQSALAAASTMTWSGPDGFRIALTDPRGVQKLATLMCRGAKIPLEACRGTAAIEAVMDVFRELHPIGEQPTEDGEEDKDAESPK